VYFLKIWLIFSFYNSTALCIVEFTSHLLSDEIRILLVEGMRAEGMGITNDNGNEPLAMGGNGTCDYSLSE